MLTRRVSAYVIGFDIQTEQYFVGMAGHCILEPRVFTEVYNGTRESKDRCQADSAQNDVEIILPSSHSMLERYCPELNS